jgi:AcrR family transcriptional regulator
MSDVKGLPRRERAAATRRSIMQAGAHEFTANGYHGATMEAIARRAGVATQTVYFVFHTKAAVLTAAVDAAVMGAENLAPEKTAWWDEATTTAGGQRAIELFVDGTVEILVRAASLNRVAQAAADTDPEVLEVFNHHERLRAIGYRRFVDTLSARANLKPGLAPEEATDILLTLDGPNMFLDLTQGRGWNVSRYGQWVGQALGLLLLPGP